MSLYFSNFDFKLTQNILIKFSVCYIMRILIIGQSVVDEIETDSGFTTKPGGIFYTVLGLSQIIKNKDQIFLLTNYTLQHKELFITAFNKANLKFSNQVENIPTVKLRIWTDKERCENYSNISQNIRIPSKINFNDFSGILVNMISGFDITADELKEIRNKFSGLIYFDVHSLARGIDEKGNRHFRRIKNITKWLNSVDILQCNENELFTLYEKSNENEIANFVLSCRPSIFIITKGKNGATLYYNLKNNIERIVVHPIKVEGKNSVGCGDVFGAAFFYFYLISKDVEVALNNANICAGLFTQYSTLEEFQKLSEDFIKYNA